MSIRAVRSTRESAVRLQGGRRETAGPPTCARRRAPASRQALTALVGVAVAIGAAACGPGIPTGAGAASGGRNALAYSQCMRAHGIPGFPDPKNGGFRINGNTTTTVVNGVSVQSALFDTADTACRHDLGPARPSAPASARQKQAALAYAQCMRAHGIKNFPDPRVTANSFTIHVTSALDIHSPLFQAAQRACKGLMPSP